jgi:hypothetical protein
MLGQPQLGTFIKFDITRFAIVEEAIEEEGAVVEILDTNEPFTLRLDFEGSGTDWNNMKGQALDYQVEFFAEGIGRRQGGGPGEYNYSGCSGKLSTTKDHYKCTYEVPNGIPREGVYRLSAMVTFPNWKGVLGFAEGLVIQVHPQEE